MLDLILNNSLILKSPKLCISVAGLQHLDADPGPACHYDADPDPSIPSDADPDPDPSSYLDADPHPDPTFQIKAHSPKKGSQIGSYSMRFGLSSSTLCGSGSGSSLSLRCGSGSGSYLSI